jgi:hypothetical protein
LYIYISSVHCFVFGSNLAAAIKEAIMADDPSVKQDYQGGISADAAANAGRQAAQNGLGLAPQQPNESSEAYNMRVNAYNEAKNSQQH